MAVENFEQFFSGAPHRISADEKGDLPGVFKRIE